MGKRFRRWLHFVWLFFLIALPLSLISNLAMAGDDSADQNDEEMFDLGAMGDYDNSSTPAAGSEFGGVNAVFSGELINKAAQDLRKDNEEEFLFSDITFISAKTAVNLSPGFTITLEGLFEYHFEINESRDQGNYSFDLLEGNGKWKLGPVDITIGQQMVAWGIVDGINPTDIVNPRNYNRFLDTEMNLGKLPVPMGRVEYYMPHNLKLDFVVLPFFVPARLNIVGQDVSLFGHDFPFFFLKSELRKNPDWRNFERGLEFYYPDWEKDIDAVLENQEFWDFNTRDFDDDFTHGEGAIRFSGRAGAFDFSTSYMYLWDDIPTIHLNPEFLDLLTAFSDTPAGYMPIPNIANINPEVLARPFTLTHHRTHTVGADLGASVEGFGLRWEGAYTFSKYTYTEQMETRTKPLMNSAFNIDYMFEGQFLVSTVFFSSSLLNYSNELFQPPSFAIFMIMMRKPWLDEKLTTELAAAYDFSYLKKEDWEAGEIFNEGGMVSPFITYAITDPMKISVGANVLWGEDYKLFGIIKNNTRAFVSMKYNF